SEDPSPAAVHLSTRPAFSADPATSNCTAGSCVDGATGEPHAAQPANHATPSWICPSRYRCRSCVAPPGSCAAVVEGADVRSLCCRGSGSPFWTLYPESAGPTESGGELGPNGWAGAGMASCGAGPNA